MVSCRLLKTEGRNKKSVVGGLWTFVKTKVNCQLNKPEFSIPGFRWDLFKGGKFMFQVMPLKQFLQEFKTNYVKETEAS